MPSLLDLPREIRDHIWALLCTEENERPTAGYFGTNALTSSTRSPNASESIAKHAALRTCRQMCHELGANLYHRVYINLSHSDEALGWISTIGPRNSSCIRHLALHFTSLPIGEDQHLRVRDRMTAWAALLRCLPSLLSLTFNSSNHGRTRSDHALHSEGTFAHESFVCNELALSAKAWSERLLLPSYKPSPAQWSQEEANLPSRPITHAFLSIDESMPPILVQYFQNSTKTNSFPLSHRSETMDMGITNLPTTFFPENGYRLSRTSVFNENSEHPSATLTYVKDKTFHQPPVAESLKAILADLPDLLYLRIGCRNLDSSFLPHLPPGLQTLDVAFTDADPRRIAENLRLMHARCRKLFTFAIAVSPLHDRDPHDDVAERFFNRAKFGEEISSNWRPFWVVLDEIQESGVKVWEGRTNADPQELIAMWNSSYQSINTFASRRTVVKLPVNSHYGETQLEGLRRATPRDCDEVSLGLDEDVMVSGRMRI